MSNNPFEINLGKTEKGDPYIQFTRNEDEHDDSIKLTAEIISQVEGDYFDEMDVDAMKEEIRKTILGHWMQVSGAMLQNNFSEESSEGSKSE